MQEKDRRFSRPDHGLRAAAKEQPACAPVAIAAHNQQIGAAITRCRSKRFGRRAVIHGQDARVSIVTMPMQLADDLCDGLGLRVSGLPNADKHHALGLGHERHRRRDGAGRVGALFPAYRDVPKRDFGAVEDAISRGRPRPINRLSSRSSGSQSDLVARPMTTRSLWRA